MKTIKIIFTTLEVICVGVAASTIFMRAPAFVFPAAMGAIFLLFGLEGLATHEVGTRINVILRNRNKVSFYLMVITWLLFSAFWFWHSATLT